MLNYKHLSLILENLTNLSAMIIIFIGIVYFIYLLVSMLFLKKNKIRKTTIKARIIIASSISLSLTLMLASDIIKSVRSTSYSDLGKLGIIILLRQFVTYFLDKEIKDLRSGKIH